MSEDLLGTVAVALALGLLGWGLVRMRPRWPYLGLALVLFVGDLGMRAAAPQFPDDGKTPFVYMENPATQTEEDVGWPNRVVVFLLFALTVWLTVRPKPRALLVGIGLALLVPGGILNLAEPLLRGFTTDYLLIGDWIANVGDFGLVFGLLILVTGVVVAEIKGVKGAKGVKGVVG